MCFVQQQPKPAIKLQLQAAPLLAWSHTSGLQEHIARYSMPVTKPDNRNSLVSPMLRFIGNSSCFSVIPLKVPHQLDNLIASVRASTKRGVMLPRFQRPAGITTTAAAAEAPGSATISNVTSDRSPKPVKASQACGPNTVASLGRLTAPMRLHRLLRCKISWVK